MKKIVRNEDAFTQRFRTAKGVQTRCPSPDPFYENMVREVYTAKVSGPYQLTFYGSGPIFFCSVNGALELQNEHLLLEFWSV